MKRRTSVVLITLIVGACQPAAETRDKRATSQSRPVPTASPVPVEPVEPATPGTPGGLPDDRTPLSEPKGPIDPKSAEAAGQVMQHYAALIEARKVAEAGKLWGPAADSDPRIAFDALLAEYAEIHAQVGKPGDSEGAAGSIYITVPFALYGRLTSGAQSHRAGTATLRRLNDVPGSTQAQRRWHIEGIDLK